MAILKYNGEFLSYDLIRRKGMKNIRICVKDGSVRVSADASVSLRNIESFMLRKINWILKHTGSDNSGASVAPEMHGGLKLRIFGKVYELNIVKGETGVFASGDTLFIYSPDLNNQSALEILLLRFAAEKGRETLSRYFDKYISKTNHKGANPNLSLKILKSKWGHYRPSENEIMLNLALCGLPEELIEYVAAHEAAHLFLRNHSAEFYSFGEELLPGFKAFDRQLNKYSADFWGNVVV